MGHTYLWREKHSSMTEKKNNRLRTFDPRLWIPVCIVSALAYYLFISQVAEDLGSAFFASLLIGGGAIGLAASWLISTCWNIISLYSSQKSNNIAAAIQCGIGFHEWQEWRYVADGNCEQMRRCPFCGEEERRLAHSMGELHYACVATLAGMPSHTERFEALLSARFGQSELREFCFKNGIDPENLEGDSKIENIQSLIRSHNRKKSIGTLIDALKGHRADLADELDQIFPPSLSKVAASKEEICVQHADCTRCGHIEEDADHLYSEWLREREGKCTFIRRCERCEEQESKTEHKWSSKQYISVGSCRQEKMCWICNLRDDEGELHTYVEHEELAADKRTKTKVKVCSRCGNQK